MGLTVPFGLRGSEGSLAVECGVNGDPRRLGYHLLGLPYDLEVARGFPVVRASVSFPGEGYAGAMGWIQVLRYGSGGLGDERIEVDLPPQHQDSNTPYCFWGIQPTFFDAPSTPHEDVTWTAEAFLATSPDALMTRTVRPICGFRWGYATTRKPPQILPPESLDRGAWEAAPRCANAFPLGTSSPSNPRPP